MLPSKRCWRGNVPAPLLHKRNNPMKNAAISFADGGVLMFCLRIYAHSWGRIWEDSHPPVSSRSQDRLRREPVFWSRSWNRNCPGFPSRILGRSSRWLPVSFPHSWCRSCLGFSRRSRGRSNLPPAPLRWTQAPRRRGQQAGKAERCPAAGPSDTSDQD